MTRKSGQRRERDKRQSSTEKVEKALGKEMLLSLVGRLVELLGGVVTVDIAELARPRDIGMRKDEAGAW